ncbi:hypothetical protein V5O48_017878 [Marasmius crinis-equi]|uniref:Uncharacterized protein n=1 Tax=Marasmius crinis-equi TaxID=585013 RepID=A0ABR3EMQ0_9AGAR
MSTAPRARLVTLKEVVDEDNINAPPHIPTHSQSPMPPTNGPHSQSPPPQSSPPGRSTAGTRLSGNNDVSVSGQGTTEPAANKDKPNSSTTPSASRTSTTNTSNPASSATTKPNTKAKKKQKSKRSKNQKGTSEVPAGGVENNKAREQEGDDNDDDTVQGRG